MFFLNDDVNKVSIGWSAKCGCSFVKNMFKFYTDKKYSTIDRYFDTHTKDTYGNIPYNHENYKMSAIIRNPYKRFVSGYIDLYVRRGLHLNIENLNFTFEDLVNELEINGLKNINKHHFTPQLSEKWKSEIKFEKVFDISNINYNYYNNVFNKSIDAELNNINRGNHKSNYSSDKKEIFYNKPRIELKRSGIIGDYTTFYNQELKDKVYNFFENDFNTFAEWGFDYNFNID